MLENTTGLTAPVASASVLERAGRLVPLIRDLVKCDAVALTASNPFALSPQHKLLAADGYSDAALRRSPRRIPRRHHGLFVVLAEASNLLHPHRVLADEVHGDAHVALIGGTFHRIELTRRDGARGRA
ncbi:hypothetical protein OG943_09350 [Amycolatopsis sp. NBC_00345]|uniref:hypothetical protein n=1 Tax=Amycolatopsis sp. NBC_00345 TaxID=2975955 RepID=UPI002E26B13D